MSIIKDICYNPDNGRLILSDSENNHYLCDLFGRKYPEFLPDITGFVNGKKRKKLAPLSFSSQITIPTYQHFTEYYPTIRRFEGYSKFPRPLVPPFANIPNYDLKDNCKKELIKQLQKYFSNNEAKVFIGKENENKGLSYLTCDLNQCDVAKEDSVKLLKIIDETFKSYRQIYKYQLNTLKTNPVLVALTQFKEVLSRNENMKIINGRLLKIPGNEIIEKYNSIHERMRKIGLKHMKIVKKEYSKTYRNEVPDINEITNSSDITLGKRIYGKFGIYSYEEEQRKKEEEEKRLEEEEKRKEEEEKRLKLMEEKLKKELEEKLKMEEEERIKNAILKANITTFYSTLNRIYHSQNRKNYYFYFFLNQIKNILSYQFDYYLDYENNDQEYNNFIQSKIRFFLGKKFLNEYLVPLKKEKEKKIIYNEYIKKANKFIQYRNYKMKAFIYEALFNFAKKQKQWIKNTQSELLKGLIWSCIDNMKLYVNYKKIKRYFIQKKKKRIFDAIKNNKLLSLEMARKAKKLSLIFEYKLFFKFTRKRILSKKGEDVNKKICEEFRKQSQMKNIFKTLQLYYKMKLNKKTKTKKLFNFKHENKDFINIRVTQKETVKYNDNSTTKKISNRINVV